MIDLESIGPHKTAAEISSDIKDKLRFWLFLKYGRLIYEFSVIRAVWVLKRRKITFGLDGEFFKNVIYSQALVIKSLVVYRKDIKNSFIERISIYFDLKLPC